MLSGPAVLGCLGKSPVVKDIFFTPQVKVNDKFVKASDGMYTVQLPALTEQRAVPLMSESAYR